MTEEIITGLAKPEYILAVVLLLGAGRLISKVADRFLTLMETKLQEVVQNLSGIREELVKLQIAMEGIEHRVDRLEKS
jgi:hypothetical protein